MSRATRGPLTPPRRDPSSSISRSEWGRWDTAGGRTVYVADSAFTAYAEVLAYLRPHLPTNPLGDYFDDADPAEAGHPFGAVAEAGMTAPDWLQTVPPGWRHDRRLHTMRLAPPSNGWFVDIEHSDSVGVFAAALQRRDPNVSLTVSDMTGEDRSLTTVLASVIRDATLDDGSRAHGIQYMSKHGSNLRAWAVWLRAIDDGKPMNAEDTACTNTQQITASDAALQAAAQHHSMRIRPGELARGCT